MPHHALHRGLNFTKEIEEGKGFKPEINSSREPLERDSEPEVFQNFQITEATFFFFFLPRSHNPHYCFSQASGGLRVYFLKLGLKTKLPQFVDPWYFLCSSKTSMQFPVLASSKWSVGGVHMDFSCSMWNIPKNPLPEQAFFYCD